MKEFDDFIQIISKLRSPNGCPWDKKQTHDSLKPYFIEEVYEVIEAIDEKGSDELADELGDVLLQIALHAQIASENDEFDIKDVITLISEKMIRRHPHVFGTTAVKDAEEVLVNWEKIKKKEKGLKEDPSMMASIQEGLPALYRARKIQRKAAGVGFDWPEVSGAWDKVKEEMLELEKEIENYDSKSRIKEEFGDLLFSLVNVARKLDFDAEDALRQTNRKFIKRFKVVEEEVIKSGKAFEDHSLEELDKFWDLAKENT